MVMTMTIMTTTMMWRRERKIMKMRMRWRRRKIMKMRIRWGRRITIVKIMIRKMNCSDIGIINSTNKCNTNGIDGK